MDTTRVPGPVPWAPFVSLAPLLLTVGIAVGDLGKKVKTGPNSKGRTTTNSKRDVHIWKKANVKRNVMPVTERRWDSSLRADPNRSAKVTSHSQMGMFQTKIACRLSF